MADDYVYKYDMEVELAYRHRNVTSSSSKDWEWAIKMDKVKSPEGVGLTIATFADGHKEEMPTMARAKLMAEMLGARQL